MLLVMHLATSPQVLTVFSHTVKRQVYLADWHKFIIFVLAWYIIHSRATSPDVDCLCHLRYSCRARLTGDDNTVFIYDWGYVGERDAWAMRKYQSNRSDNVCESR